MKITATLEGTRKEQKQYLPTRLQFMILTLRHYALDIAIAICVVALICVVGMMSWLSMTSPDAVAIDRQQQEYFKKLEKEQNTPAAKRAWNRLNRKHGQPGAVIYEAGKTPWYVNRDGQKCRFI